MSDSVAFRPDWTSPPGETVADILEERRLTVDHLARRMGQTLEQVMELLDGRVALTLQTAKKLELVLGAPAAFWMTRENQYRNDLTRLQRQSKFEVQSEWLSEFPIADMTKFGWIPKVTSAAEKMSACLRFFDVTDPSEWRKAYQDILETAAFRTSPSFKSDRGAIAAWLRQGERKSTELTCQPWNPMRFKEVLPDLRPLTRRKEPARFVPELTERCAECGVAVVIVRAPARCRASGATRFLSPSRALLLLSFRYLSDDHFWFTFFHEAGHLLLHGEKALFLEGVVARNEEEEEANEFAARMLIPPNLEPALSRLQAQAREVIRFSRLVGVSPGIVVGQLQHRGRIGPSQLNSLKRRFQWE